MPITKGNKGLLRQIRDILVFILGENVESVDESMKKEEEYK